MSMVRATRTAIRLSLDTPGPDAMKGSSRQPLPVLLVSIDTEEDQWEPTLDAPTTQNIRELPRLHEFLVDLGVRPTYFTNHAVAVEPESSAIIRDIAASGTAEIGAHLHPWNTPPPGADPLGRNTMLCNLPYALQRAKLKEVLDALTTATGSRPESFRAGRYGFDAQTARALLELGVRIDSSVTPFTDWRTMDEGPDFSAAPLHVYRTGGAAADVSRRTAKGPLVEVPSSVGYTRHPFVLWHRVHSAIDHPRLRALRLAGVASAMGLCRKVMLTPEGERTADLVALSSRLLELSPPYLHLTLHSPSMVPGLTPFTRTEGDVAEMLAGIRAVAELCRSRGGFTAMTVSEAAAWFAPTASRDTGRPLR